MVPCYSGHATTPRVTDILLQHVFHLCSGFWEPDIPSNLVHAWIWPPLWDFNIKKNGPLNEAHLYQEAIVRGCISRRPNPASLYLGAALTKLFGFVVYYVELGLSMMNLSTAA